MDDEKIKAVVLQSFSKISSRKVRSFKTCAPIVLSIASILFNVYLLIQININQKLYLDGVVKSKSSLVATSSAMAKGNIRKKRNARSL